MPVTATLSRKFRISIPKAVREEQHWEAGQEFVFIPKGKGVLVIPVPERKDLAGIAKGVEQGWLPQPQGPLLRAGWMRISSACLTFRFIHFHGVNVVLSSTCPRTAKHHRPPRPREEHRHVESMSSAVHRALRHRRGVVRKSHRQREAFCFHWFTCRVLKAHGTTAKTAHADKGVTRKARELERLSKQLREQMEALGQVQTTLMRVRDKSFGDRHMVVTYYPDPELKGSVLMRLTPTTPLTEPSTETKGPDRLSPAEKMLSTGEVAEQLQVSRPYVTKLVDEGKFKGVQVTEGGHRRIPSSAVLEVQKEMRKARSAGLAQVRKLSSEAIEHEVAAAREDARSSGRVWIKKKP